MMTLIPDLVQAQGSLFRLNIGFRMAAQAGDDDPSEAHIQSTATGCDRIISCWNPDLMWLDMKIHSRYNETRDR